MKKDLMIGVFSNLPFAAVAPWLRSVHACGFTGDKVIVAIGVDAGVTARLADGWACNLHVTHKPDQREEFGPYLLEPRPLIADGMVRNQAGDLFHIVHQWDRVPDLVEAVVERYLSPAEIAEA